MEPGPPDGPATPAPRPMAQRVAAGVTIAVLVLGFPLGIVVYSVGGEDTQSFVGALMAVMTGAVVVAWFYTRARKPPEASPGSSEPT